MNSIDFSRATYADIERGLGALRVTVWNGLKRHGPCTTAELAERMEMSLLTVRPRITELMHLGLARLATSQRGHEGVYEAGSVQDAAELQFQHDGMGQTELRLQA